MRVLGRAAVAYLRQSQELSGAGTLLDALLEPFADLQRLHDAAHRHRGRAARAATPAMLARYGEMQERYQHQGGYELEARVKRLMTDVGFAESRPRRAPSRRCRAASAGGWSWRRCWCRSPICCCSTSRPTTWISAAIERLESVPRRVHGRVPAGVARPRVHPRRLPRDRRARGRQVRPLPVRLRQVRRRARRALRARARRLRAPEGARRQDRGLHPPQPRRPEDQAGAEPAQDAREAGPPRAARRRVGARRQDRARRSRRAAISAARRRSARPS